MKGMNFVITLAIILTVITQCIPTLMAQDVEDEPLIDPYTASLVCAAAAIIAEDEVTAGWFATNVDNTEGIEHFLKSFARGLESGAITSEDVADTIEACIMIKAGVEALE